MKYPIPVCLILALAAAVRGDELDNYVRTEMETKKIPAVVFGIFKDGKILRKGAYGFSNVELKVPATVDNIFEIGSISKPFTAMLILMLVQDGRLQLSDRLDKHLDQLPETWRAVTLRQLLTHTSGIPDIEQIFGYDSYRNIYTFTQIVSIANSRPPDFPPGQKMGYSNTGYYLLAHVAQRVEGKPFDRLLKERIFDPLGMTHTRQSDPSEVIPNRCAGYQLTDQGLKNRDAMQPTSSLGAGAIVSCIEDMAKWDWALTHDRLLRAETQRQMWQKTRLATGESDYGFGWFIGDMRGHPTVSHSGGTAGFSSNFRRFQDLGLSTMFFTNLYATNVGDIELRATDTVHPGLSYVSVKPIKDDPKISEMLLKAMADVAEGGTGSPYITSAMWKAYPEVSHRDWKHRLSTLKSFELLEHTHYAPIATGLGDEVVETYVYRLQTEDQTLFVVFKLRSDGLIALQQRVEN